MAKKKKKETIHEDRVIRCRVIPERQFFPKPPAVIHDGDFGIVTAKVIWQDNSEAYVKPILHPVFKSITIKGDSLPHIKLDGKTEYTLQAYETESDYGTSYTVKMMGEMVDLSSPDKQRAFLRQILTERQVDALFEAFIDPISAIKEGTKDELKQIKGFGDKAVERLMKKVMSTEDMSEVLIELEAYKLTKREIDGLIVHYKNPRLVVDMVKQNPYVLMDVVNRIGFIRSDEVAQNGGFNPKSPKRVAAYIRHFLNEQADKGNSWVYTNVLIQAIDDYFSNDYITDETISRALKSLIKDKYLWHSADKQRVGLQYIFDIEKGIAKELKRLLSCPNKFKYSQWEGKVRQQEETQGWNYTEEQYNGIKTVLDHNVVLVQGLAGVGKSSIISGMLCAYDEEYQVATTALSGRAAVNISETARKNGMEVDGKTIHRLLKVASEDGEFVHHEGNPLLDDVIILDEVSMVNIELMYSLLKAVKNGAKLIMLGDSGQLPSVGAGNFMSDILNSSLIPTVTLTKVHRQAAASGIISESIKIRHGEMPCLQNDNKVEVRGELQDLVMDLHTDSSLTFHKVVDHFKAEWEKLDDIMDILVVVPMRERGSSSAYHINNAIQSYLFQRTLKTPYIVNQGQKNEFKLYVGDKIINNKNDYEVTGADGGETAIFNGNIGIILDIDFENHILTVDFGDVGVVLLEARHIKNISLGYAITIHKSQGSGVKTVICAANYESYVMLSQELIYTAITRAKERCIVVAESSALRFAASKSSLQNKQTFLPELLND